MIFLIGLLLKVGSAREVATANAVHFSNLNSAFIMCELQDSRNLRILPSLWVTTITL